MFLCNDHFYSFCHTALLAMKGMMLQEELTLDEAFKVMDLSQNEPSRVAPALPPQMLGMNIKFSEIVAVCTCMPVFRTVHSLSP